MSEFVTRKKFAQEMGLSERAFEKWIYPKDKAPLKENVHWIKARGRVLINKREVAKWIRAQVRQESEFTKVMYGSESQETRNTTKKKLAPTAKLTWNKRTGKDSD
tara:strand:+ start:183 stop:497 length:315 start_codon:yes stop_codon:yes gene_type:complete